MSYVKYTKTSTFLFPLLEIPKELFKCEVKNNFQKLIMTTRFLNSYMQDSEITKYNDEPYVFIVIKPYQDVDFDTFYSTILSFPNYVDEYEKEGYIIMIFKIPDNNLPDYELLLKGKYSLISKEAKTLILKNNFFSHAVHLLPLILKKCSSIKESIEINLSISVGECHSIANLYDQEVWGIITIEKETLTDDILKIISKDNKLVPSKGVED